MTKKLRHGKRWALGGAAAVVALGSAGVAAAAGANASAAPTIADYELAALAEPSSSRATLPAGTEEAFQNYQLSTFRLAGQDENAQYWVGLDVEGSLCVTAFVGGEDWSAGTSCTDPVTFANSGAGLRLYTPETSLEVYVVPDSAMAEVSRELPAVGANLVTFDPYAPTQDRGIELSAKTVAGDPFTLRMFDGPLDLGDPK